MAKKRRGWLSDIFENREDVEQHPAKENEEFIIIEESEREDLDALSEPVEDEGQEEKATKEILSIKEDEDKITFDLIVAVKNIVNDRQLTINSLNNVQSQLSEAIEKNIKLKGDIRKKEKDYLEAQEFIRNLEDKLTTKQMNYDQLLEDYKQYQERAKAEIDNVKFLFQKEQEKYVKLTIEAKNHQNEAQKKIDSLEERIRDLEAENKNINEQYQNTIADKNQLLQTINEFTNRFTGKTSPSVTLNEKFQGEAEAPKIKVD